MRSLLRHCRVQAAKKARAAEAFRKRQHEPGRFGSLATAAESDAKKWALWADELAKLVEVPPVPTNEDKGATNDE